MRRFIKVVDEMRDFLEDNTMYTVSMFILALVSGIESVFQFSFGKVLLPAWVDHFIFFAFCTDLGLKFAIFFFKKLFEDSAIRFSSLFNTTFATIDLVSLVPDLIGLFVGTYFIDLKIIRIVRAFKLLRLTRIISKNKRIIRSVNNFFRYRLYGQSLVFGMNLFALGFFCSLIAFINFEYSVYKYSHGDIVDSFKWAMNLFTSPFGKSYESSESSFLQIMAFIGSSLGLFIYASIIGVLSNVYKGLFDILDKGVSMTTIKKGDFVIIGWNHLIPTLVKHIIETQEKRAVVISGFDKSEIRKQFESMHDLDVFNNPNFEYSKLDYSNSNELQRMNIWNANKIVIVYDEDILLTQGDSFNTGNARDAKVLFTLKIVKNLIGNRQYKPRIMCEVFNKANKFLFDEYSDIEIISKESLFSNVFSQSVIQDEILNVYKRLLKTEDKELYIVPFDSEEGQLAREVSDYYECQKKYSTSGIGLIGLYFRCKNGGRAGVVISPSENELLQANKAYASENFIRNFILLAESPKEVKRFVENFSVKTKIAS